MRITRAFLFAAFIVGGLLMAASISVPNLIHARSTAAAAPCINFLRQIDAAKFSWELACHKTKNDVPTWADLRRYVKGEPVELPKCPAGGTYTIRRVGAAPKCSIGGPGHTLPE